MQHMLRKAYFILYETDLCDKIMAHINQSQFRSLLDSVSERIRFERDMMVSSVAQKVNELVNKMDEVMSESQNVLNHIDSDNFGKAIENLSRFGQPDSGETGFAAMNDSITEAAVPHDGLGENVVLLKHASPNK